MMRAILVTDLERAIIDKLRNGHVCLRAITCNNIGLPYSPDALAYSLECIERAAERRGESKDWTAFEKATEQTRQKARERQFRDDGYMGAIEFGTGAAAPFLQMLEGQKAGRSE